MIIYFDSVSHCVIYSITLLFTTLVEHIFVKQQKLLKNINLTFNDIYNKPTQRSIRGRWWPSARYIEAPPKKKKKKNVFKK